MLNYPIFRTENIRNRVHTESSTVSLPLCKILHSPLRLWRDPLFDERIKKLARKSLLNPTNFSEYSHPSIPPSPPLFHTNGSKRFDFNTPPSPIACHGVNIYTRLVSEFYSNTSVGRRLISFLSTSGEAICAPITRVSRFSKRVRSRNENASAALHKFRIAARFRFVFIVVYKSFVVIEEPVEEFSCHPFFLSFLFFRGRMAGEQFEGGTRKTENDFYSANLKIRKCCLIIFVKRKFFSFPRVWLDQI